MNEVLPSARIAICVPSLGAWEDEFSFSLEKLCMFAAQHPFPGYRKERGVSLYKKTGSLLPKLREDFFEDCKKSGETHALLLDADQTFPPDTIHRLLAHKKPIVAANVATKTIPSLPTARLKDGTPWGSPCLVAQKRGLERVWMVGCAVMLVDLSVLEKLGRGLFEVTWNPKINQYMGEDWTFCRHCEDKGIPIHVDHDLSRQVGHVGRYIFTHKDVPAMEQEKAA